MRVIQATGHVQPHASVPAAPTYEREAPQGHKVHLASDDDLPVSSQPEPEVTPVEPPPTKSSKPSVDPTIWDRINSLGAISISQLNSSTQRTVVTADAVDGDPNFDIPPSLVPSIDNILKRYHHFLRR